MNYEVKLIPNIYSMGHKYPAHRVWGLQKKSLVTVFKTLPYSGIWVKKKLGSLFLIFGENWLFD